jgi:hypothetical protein
MPDYGIGSWPERRARISGQAIALRQLAATAIPPAREEEKIYEHRR